MAQGFPKQNQSSPRTDYRFGDCELLPRDRLLTKGGVAVSLQPKAFDALLCLVRRAQHLVSKRELMDTLWPSLHVSESNLTNVIVSLRKILGRQAIRTVSKHGYRFDLPVESEPGVPPETYERLLRAQQLMQQRSVKAMLAARELLWTCVAEAPEFSAGWAWLGRCCWFLQKFRRSSEAGVALAQAVFARAFHLDHDLAIAHEFFTLLEVDTGHAARALPRLMTRLAQHPGEPESLIGLVQVYRFSGMLEESLEAHALAIRMEPAAQSSVAHTLFACGRYPAAIEAYAGRTGYYLDAACWAALGRKKHAAALLRERLTTLSLSPLMKALLGSLRATLEARTEDAVRQMQSTDTAYEPEISVYFARHYAALGRADLAIAELRSAARAGFVCAPTTLRNDPWVQRISRDPGLPSLIAELESRVTDARTAAATFRASPSRIRKN